MSKSMKIELLKTCLAGNSKDPQRAGTVIESDDPVQIDNFKALVKVGYAKETNKAVTVAKDAAPQNPANDPTEDAIKTVLAGNVPQVVEQIGAFNADELKRALELESAGKNREGVKDALTAAINQG